MLILTASVSSHLSYSQKITNVDFEVIGNTVKISYDINGCSEDKNYDIKLSLGREGELTEISRGLSGDIKNVPCGSSKVILWDVLSDRNELKGQVYFGVEIQRIHQEHQEIREQKRSMKGKIGAPDPGKQTKDTSEVRLDFSHLTKPIRRRPYNPQQNGFFINTTIGYLPSLLLGSIHDHLFLWRAEKKNQKNNYMGRPAV